MKKILVVCSGHMFHDVQLKLAEAMAMAASDIIVVDSIKSIEELMSDIKLLMDELEREDELNKKLKQQQWDKEVYEQMIISKEYAYECYAHEPDPFEIEHRKHARPHIGRIQTKPVKRIKQRIHQHRK